MTYNTKIGFKFEIKATLKTTTNENKTKKLVFQASYFYY